MKVFVFFLSLCAVMAFSSARIKSSATQFQIKRNFNGRIIGGQQANAGQFPFSAAIYVSTISGRYFCGGALINQQWVVTAAHCTRGGYVFQISLGSNLLEGTDPNRVTVSTATYFNHPEFDPDTLQNDVGLIRFHFKISYTEYIQPINLPTDDEEDYTSSIALGWGAVSDSSAILSDVLNFVEVTAIPNTECQLSFANTIFDTMVCVAGNYNEGACRGDSGSPLMTTRNHENWLIGVSSFISTNGCETSEPSGYTRINSYAEWIKNTTEIE